MQQMEEIYFIFFISVLYNIQNPKSYLNYDQQEYNYFDKSWHTLQNYFLHFVRTKETLFLDAKIIWPYLSFSRKRNIIFQDSLDQRSSMLK